VTNPGDAAIDAAIDAARRTEFDGIFALGDNHTNLARLVTQLASPAGVIPFVGAGMSVPFGMPDWRSFLRRIAPDEPARVMLDARLARGEYEEAAEDLMRLRGETPFQDALEATFGAAALQSAAATQALSASAVSLLPALVRGPVLTTNFDDVLERVFESAGRPFDTIVSGMRIDGISTVMHQRAHAVVHLHGTARERTDRVLTFGDYERHYGARQPLEAVLRAFMTQPILFLGSSLNGDRPVRALRAEFDALDARGAGALQSHFAVLEYPSDDARRRERLADLASMGVRPIWYPPRAHHMVRDILAYLVERTALDGIDVPARAYSAKLFEDFRLDATGLALSGATGHARAMTQAYAGTRYEVGRDRLSLEQLLESRRRVVLLGEPGSGKSVTAKRALQQMSTRYGLIPIFLRLADFVTAFRGRGDIPAAALLQAFADRATELGAPGCDARFFERAIVQERAVIALDGFDEIGSKALRDRVAGAIARLGDWAPNARILVTSRPAEYHESPLPKPIAPDSQAYVEATALPLEPTQIRALLRDSLGDDGRLWQEIRRDQQILSLARTPLLVTLLALLGQRGPLPPGDQIYDAVVSTAIGSWEAAKGEPVADGARRAREELARRALEELALAMQQRESSAAPLTEALAHSALGEASALLDELVNRTGLLVRFEQRGAKSTRATVQFVHLQLQEFLAGSALGRRLLNGDPKAHELLKRWDSDFANVETQLFAAQWLATKGADGDESAFTALEAWVRSRLSTPSQTPIAAHASLVASAQLLCKADAEFFPATDLTDAIVEGLTCEGELDEDTVLAALSLAPRPASLKLARDVALETTSGRALLDRVESIDRASATWGKEGLRVECVRIVCRFGDRSDALTATTWPLANVRTLTAVVYWGSLTDAIADVHGVDCACAWVHELTFDNPWLERDYSPPVVELLDIISVSGAMARQARKLAEEGILRPPRATATARFAEWLEGQGEPAALALCDAYYDRLREAIAASDVENDWGGNWSYLPLWPARESAATDALRREVLRHRHTAWYVMRNAMGDARYWVLADGAWLDIVRHDHDRSRRRGLVYEMLHEPDVARSTPLLLDALNTELGDRWFGRDIVQHFGKMGAVEVVRERIKRLVDDSPALQGQRDDLVYLLSLCNEFDP